MGMPGPWELIIILAIVALLFGTKKLRNIGGDLGDAVKGFKKAMKEPDQKLTQDETETSESSVIDEKVDNQSKQNGA